MASGNDANPISASCSGSKSIAEEKNILKIVEPLEDITVKENANAVFECEVNDCAGFTATWFKDGVPIQPSDGIKCYINQNKYKLNISTVKLNDHGIYAVFIKNEETIAYSMASLFVGLMRNKFHHNSVLYISPDPNPKCVKTPIKIIKHLKKVTVNVGDKIRLEVECHSEDVISYYWFKNNQEIDSSDRIDRSDKKNSSNLNIEKAALTDTGVYLVVARTESGVVSSYIDVHVIQAGLDVLADSNNIIPNITEHLPEEMEISSKENLLLLCSASHDLDTEIQWYEDDDAIKEDQIYEMVDFGYHCVGLRCRRIELGFMRPYKVVLRDPSSGRAVSSSCRVIVYPVLTPERPSVTIRKPLESAIACFGARVSFQCSFALDDLKYLYVVWYIGHYTVERSNTRFNVICNGGDFHLVVKQLEPCMPGEVVCELRMALPNQQSISVASTSAYLTVVPLSYLKGEYNDNPEVRTKLNEQIVIFRNSVIKIIKNNLDGREHMNPDCTVLNKCDILRHMLDEVILEFKYSRLPEEETYYMDLLDEPDDNASIVVHERLQKLVDTQQKVVVIEWSKNVNYNFWYGIELCQANEQFVMMGVSNTSKFDLAEPPVGETLTFRIRALEPQSVSSEFIGCIEPWLNHLPKEDKQYELKPLKQLSENFIITDDVIGRGAFAKVYLIQNKNGEYYAAKIIKTPSEKRRVNALKEYEMMKKLNHTKLAQLVEAFRGDNQMLLVMEYFWGGELFDRIIEEECISEIDVVLYVRQICEGLAYMHDKDIVHLDLKPENIVCLSPNSRQIKLIDFGLAKVVSDGEILRSLYGTREYIAPEILNFDELTTISDMWSLGVVTYVMLSGTMPFSGDPWSTLLGNILRIDYNYDDRAFNEISDAAKDFIDHLLVRRQDRMSAATALQHRWLQQGPSKDAKLGHMKRAQESLKSYLADYRAKWQRVGNAMIAMQRFRMQASRSVAPATEETSQH